MVEAIINSIIEAEEKAENIKKEATMGVKKIIGNAEIKAEEIRSNSIKDLRHALRESDAAAENVAEKEYQKIIENGKIQAEKLKEKAGASKGKGTKFLYDSIINI